MKVIQAKDFKTRKDLEQYIKANDGFKSIKGTEQELARLSLSEKSLVFGVKCDKIGKSKNKVIINKINRGETIHPYGLNGKLTNYPSKKGKTSKKSTS